VKPWASRSPFRFA